MCNGSIDHSESSSEVVNRPRSNSTHTHARAHNTQEQTINNNNKKKGRKTKRNERKIPFTKKKKYGGGKKRKERKEIFKNSSFHALMLCSYLKRDESSIHRTRGIWRQTTFGVGMQFDKDRRENTQMINDKEQDSNLCDSERNFNRQTVYIRSGTGREETDVGKEMRKDIAEFHVLFLFFFFWCVC